MFVLGIIPARGGSKGIKRKNIYLLSGKPLIAYTIEAALKSKKISKVTVSTDDLEIAQIAKKYGAEVPIMRPEELAKDDSPGILSLFHMVEYLENTGTKIDIIVTLQPTSPLRTNRDIDAVIDKLISTNSDSVISVNEVKQTPYLMFRVENDRLKPFFGEEMKINRQALPKVYSLNGAIYATKRDVLMKQRTVYGEDIRPYIMPEERSIDIDTLFDTKIAEMILTNQGAKNA
jgi:CMP-N-acetylneuraminic acid synthetase